MKFKDFLMKEYQIGEKSARDYEGRLNGLINKGIYKGESQITNIMRETIEKEFSKSEAHYLLTIERYIAFQERILKKREKLIISYSLMRLGTILCKT
ncbi:hypothetical protein MHI57_22835 [Cytobacillus sp. FSL K6-0129]|uniref:hypothetical protein n=1 Tax=Cytobacillus sp. FSL K6-0129 TaxID=2921421 RepID=UPI0030F79072